ncbi:DUF962 domain-containing protein [Ferrimonas balearica]|uniref:DUF962 domain-containing protein n=1 Tax=Ferrimonas balearica TaxID=44012 RepID=UPI001C997598|nr:DUF962 domain-containing protein [Ferrimonas balearica]MBY5991069.1 DUF962 domain-containing protein [Ferrimonas balearica]
MADSTFRSFAQFYPFYLREHRHPTCRALHYIGSMLVLALLAYLVLSGNWIWAWALPVIGYGFAWLGHFGFEHNRPATFRYPFYSFLGDWVMLKDWLTGQLEPKLASALAEEVKE